MPKARTFTARVGDDGRLSIATERHIQDELKLYSGRRCVVRLSRPQRSHAANRYLWGVVYKTIRKAAADAGTHLPADAWHRYFKDKYLEPGVETVAGREIVVPPSSARLDSTAFYEYVEAIRTDEEIVRALGIHIPDPDPGWRFAAGALGEP